MGPRLKARTLSLNIPEDDSFHGSPPLSASPYEMAQVEVADLVHSLDIGRLDPEPVSNADAFMFSIR